MSRTVARIPAARTGRPTIALPAPSLDLDFCLEGGIPAGAVTLSRGSPKWIWDNGGFLRTVANDLYHSDHDPVTGAPRGLLIEEARTNLCLRSEALDNGTWIPDAPALTVTADQALAPDGTTAADKVEDNNNANHAGVRQDITVADDSMPRVCSIYLKKSTSRYPGLLLNYLGGTTTLDVAIVVDLDTGGYVEFDGPSAAIGTEVLANGWVRLWVSLANNGTGNTNLQFKLFPAWNTSLNASPNAAATGSIHAWGAQVEAGTFPTSYIKTTSAAATRAADVVDTTDIAWLDQSQGTILAEFEMAHVDSAERFLYVIDDGSASNMIRASRSNGKFRPTVFSGGSQVVDMSNSGTWAAGTIYRGAFAYQANDYRAGLNGTLQEADTSGAAPTGLAALRLGAGQGGAPINFAGWVRRLRYWPARLADDLLKELTA